MHLLLLISVFQMVLRDFDSTAEKCDIFYVPSQLIQSYFHGSKSRFDGLQQNMQEISSCPTLWVLILLFGNKMVELRTQHPGHA
jgi:hypothetical protein